MIIEDVTAPGVCPNFGCWCDYRDPLCFAYPCEEILNGGESHGKVGD